MATTQHLAEWAAEDPDLDQESLDRTSEDSEEDFREDHLLFPDLVWDQDLDRAPVDCTITQTACLIARPLSTTGPASA